MSDWLAGIQTLNSSKADVIPKEWQTDDQISKSIKKSIQTARRLTREWTALKWVERKNFRCVASDGRVLSKPHYKKTKLFPK